jgi:hypothetical protein
MWLNRRYLQSQKIVWPETSAVFIAAILHPANTYILVKQLDWSLVGTTYFIITLRTDWAEEAQRAAQRNEETKSSMLERTDRITDVDLSSVTTDNDDNSDLPNL